MSGTKRQNIWSSFIIYSSFSVQLFDQELWPSLIYFFYLHTTIRPIYMVLFHLFFLLCTTIRPKYMVVFHLFFFANDHSTKIYGPLWFISFIYIRQIRPWSSFIYSFFIAQPFDQELWSSFIYFFYLKRPFDQNIWSSFISFIYTRPFDQHIWFAFIYFFFCKRPFD